MRRKTVFGAALTVALLTALTLGVAVVQQMGTQTLQLTPSRVSGG